MPYYELRPKVNENLRLNVSGNSVAANGQNVTLYSATGSNDQIWFIQEVGAKNQKILSAINQAFGLNAVTSGTWNCCLQLTGGSDASTSFDFEYATDYEGCWRVKLAGQNRYLTCDGTTSGSNVSWKAKTGGAEQVWRFYPAFVNGPQRYAYMTAKWWWFSPFPLTERSDWAKLRGKWLDLKKFFSGRSGNNKTRPAGHRPTGRAAQYSLLYLRCIV